MTKILDINNILDIIGENKEKFSFSSFGSEVLMGQQQHTIQVKTKQITASFQVPFLLESSIQDPFEVMYETYWKTVFDPEF